MPSFEVLAQQVGHILNKHRLKLVTAESCTGGGLSYWITSMPGSSIWFERGFVTYSNLAKIENLGVSQHTINTYGAVDEKTVREMAEGALKHSYAEVSIAITGIAGPAGSTPNKPVGTVWIGYAKQSAETQTQLLLLQGDRQSIREQTIEQALTGLLVFLHAMGL
jgi:nicotinamide-nucleotide amidase